MCLGEEAGLDKEKSVKKLKFLNIFEAKIIFIIIITSMIITLVVFFFMENRSRQTLVDLLRVRSGIIFSYIETFIEKETFFTINTPEDMADPIYQKNRYELDQIRAVTSLKYLYTVKRNAEGVLVYIIDGQDDKNPEFSYPGQPLDEELRKKAALALDGKEVLGDGIQDTGYGLVYITLWPVFDNGEVIGCIILEYDADILYRLDHSAIFFSALVVFFLVLLFSVFSSVVFKGISRPFHKKMAYTDVLTGLNNRTAFELDKKRIQGNLKNHIPLAMIMFDLNNLKEVNDTLGHSKGDLYLVTAAQLIQRHFGSLGQSYRIGGDEFCVISTGHDPEVLRRIMEQDFAEDADRNRGIIKSNGIDYFAVAYGMAVYDKSIHRDLYEVFILADERMYAKKRQMKTKPQGV
jgi:diguanylate cyclase (GGDEF)-like protein